MPIFILSGDFYQLPPVQAFPLYVGTVEVDPTKRNREYYDEANAGLRLYHSFFDKAVVLNENKRQAGDEVWRGMLRRIRNGEATAADAQCLAHRTLREEEKVRNPDIPRESDPGYMWQTCPRYFPKKDHTRKENFDILCTEFPHPDDRYDASAIIKVGKNKRLSPEAVASFGPKFAREAPLLSLAVGAKVMVTTNLEGARQWGIINGTTGTVMGFLSEDGGREITHVLVRPDFVMRGMPPFKFVVPDPESPDQSKEIVLEGTWPLERTKSTLYLPNGQDKTKTMTASCESFPLMLAYALTIHKAQGITTSHAVIDITQCHEGQMAYVACSRVRTLDGVRLRSTPTLNDLNKFARSKNKPLLEAEIMRIEALQASLIEHFEMQEEDARVVAELQS